jgi:hypothetical protein
MSDELNTTENTSERNSAFSTQHSKFTEAQLESAIIELLSAQGFPHMQEPQRGQTQNIKI